jgi:hypothetical protein
MGGRQRNVCVNFPVHLTAALVLALVLVGAAATKEGARARLTTPVSRDAAPGTTIPVGWTVTVPDGNGGRQPFGAQGMFVKFLTRTGTLAAPAFGKTLDEGRYAAEATVPVGGMGGIRVGLRGTTDIYFPLENDPFLSKSGLRCDAGAVSAALHRFKGAFNTGDLTALDTLFSRVRFVWYSSGGPGVRRQAAARSRATLIPYFRARHRQHDRVISFRLRFNAYDSGRGLGHFSLSGTRRADDFRGGRPFTFSGKGALDCAGQRVTIAALSVGGPAR